MAATLGDILTWGLLALGSDFLLIGSIGLVRLPDFYTRLHTAGITDTLAIVLIVAGLMVQSGLTLISVKLLFILIFLFFTSPTATHALAKAALFNGLRPWTKPSPTAKEEPTSLT
jgi:multicomponent Na+:H+ antiporter subunit G